MWALGACVRMALESRRGQWCTPAWIAGRVLASIDSVVTACEQLVEAGQAQFEFGNGTPLFGVDVVDEHPTINDAADAGSP